MIDGSDLISLETRVRHHINEPDPKLWPQATLFAHINDEVKRLARKIIDLDNGWLEQIYTPTPAATITLPVNTYIVRNVELYMDGYWQSPRWIKDRNRGQYQTSGSTWPAAVQSYKESIIFESGIGQATACRIKYARMPSPLIYCTLSSGSATTAVLPEGTGSFADDAYIDDQFIILDGTGEGQVSTVTDYVASTRTLTVASGATLDDTTVISTLLPSPLAAWADLVALGAAIRSLTRPRDAERTALLRGDYERDLADMVSTLGSRQTAQPERGNYIIRGDED